MDRGAQRRELRATGGYFLLKQREHFLGSAEPLCSRVEVLPHEANRQVGLRSEKEHEERNGEGHLTLHQSHAHRHGN